MDQQQTNQFLESLVMLIAKTVEREVIAKLDSAKVVSTAIHNSIDLDESLWDRIKKHVDYSMENNTGFQDLVESNLKDWLTKEIPHQLEHFKGSGSSSEPASSEDFAKRVDACIESWADSYLEDKIGDWCDSYLSDRIDTWMSDNFSYNDYGDIDDKIRECIRNDISFEVSVS